MRTLHKIISISALFGLIGAIVFGFLGFGNVCGFCVMVLVCAGLLNLFMCGFSDEYNCANNGY